MLAAVLVACTPSGPEMATADHCLGIRRFPSGQLLARVRLPEEGHFSLSFIHSVSETPVHDDYRLLEGRIVQTAERFQAHGAGLPSSIDEPGVTGWERQEQSFVVRMNRPISRLIVRTDRNYRNRLQVGGKEVDLNAWIDQALELAVMPCVDP